MHSEITLSRREAIKRAALVFGSTFAATALQGALRVQVGPSGSSDKLHYLTRKQLAVADALSERIIPSTDTPGASEVGVARFIDALCDGYQTEAENKLLTRGLDNVEKKSQSQHGEAFGNLSPELQDAMISAMATTTDRREKQFYTKMRELTLLGYFTSEPVCKNVLQYNPVPGPFRGCVPISETGNVAWYE